MDGDKACQLPSRRVTDLNQALADLAQDRLRRTFAQYEWKDISLRCDEISKKIDNSIEEIICVRTRPLISPHRLTAIELL